MKYSSLEKRDSELRELANSTIHFLKGNKGKVVGWVEEMLTILDLSRGDENSMFLLEECLKEISSYGILACAPTVQPEDWTTERLSEWLKEDLERRQHYVDSAIRDGVFVLEEGMLEKVLRLAVAREMDDVVEAATSYLVDRVLRGAQRRWMD